MGGLSVTGGSAGIAADCEQIARLAGRFGAVGSDTAHAVLALHGYLVDPAIA